MGLINTTPTVAGWSISGSNAPSDVIQVLQRDRLISRGLLCSTRLRTSVKASLSSVPTITFFSQERRSHPFSTSIQVSSQTCSVVWSTGDIVIVRSVDARCHLLQQSELRPSDIWVEDARLWGPTCELEPCYDVVLHCNITAVQIS